MLSRQFLNEKSNINGDEVTQEVLKVLLLSRRRISTMGRRMVRDVSRSLSPTETFPGHIIHSFSIRFEDTLP